ncbi:right-handed parallel beta-helix repeat-containing protein [Fodinicurvata halophila]|uniref:right-handed parallel beta-helix repeat-containing protein n=1 Tax=Fodinicurvata halophila TaxID=1419723 RepID=UPI0036266018
MTIGEVVEVAGGGGNLADALAAAEENGLVVAKGGDGDLDGGVELEDGQTLIGGGHNLAVRGVDSGQTMTYTAPGSRGTVIINGGEAPVVELANNTYVGGLSIQGDSSMGRDSALVGAPENTENLHIIRNDISRTGGYGAGFMKNSSDITLHENRISNTENGNIAFGEDVSNVELTRNHVSGTQGSGVGFLDGASDIRLSGNKIMDAGEHGIHFEGRSENITLTGNRVSETGRNGVYFEGSASNVTLASNDISRTGVPFDGNVDGSGLAFVDGANDIKVKRNTISETSGDGIFFTDGESISDIQLSGNSLADIDGDGIDMNADDISNVTISDNILSDIGSTGIFSYGQVTKLTVEGNLISGQEGSNSGISIYEGGSEMRLTGNSISDFDSSGMFLTGDEYEDLMVDDNSISGTGSDGIFFTSSLKDTTVKNNSIFNAEGSGISLVTGADGLVLEGNLISAIDESGIYLTGIDHDAQIDSNRFEGKIGTDLFWLGSGHYIGTDNVDATEELGGDVCADIAGTYTGPGFTIETSGGTETCGDSY